MALDNLISVSFTPEQLAALDAALSSIEGTLMGKVINLTPNERIRYASVSSEMAQWVQKCRNYMSQLPSIVPGYINLPELDADMHTRRDIGPRLRRAKAILESLDDTNLLLGSDVLTNCLAFYQSVKAAARANVPGSTGVYQDLAQQFPGRPKSVPLPPNP
ncbi:MAG: hypothetical protein HY811_05065 [Planctomycetes bacterium]|nr:hypothetical protein [Planctomycetota bacterium]